MYAKGSSILAHHSTSSAVRIHFVKMFVLKDGDMASSWSCSGDPTPDDDVFECYVTFDLFAYRQIKQVKIGETTLRRYVT